MTTPASLDLLFAKALQLLSYRPRSTQEINLRLKKITSSQKAIDQVLKRLITEKLLDDKKFAVWWVSQRVNHRPRGNFALSYELANKGIDKSIIQKVLLNSQQEKKLALTFLQSRHSKLQGLKPHQAKAKAFSWLKTRGFSLQVVYSVIDELFNN